jgi:hypothetical protein
VAAAVFKTLDESPCAFVCLFFEFLLDLVAGDLPAFEAGRLAAAFDAAALGFREARGLSDFLRVFLDIRLPFVAFRGSIIEVLDQADYRVGQFSLPGLCSKGFWHAIRPLA